MNRCETCRWWERDPWGIDAEWGECQKGRSVNGERVMGDSLAMAMDGEGWEAWLQTWPGFSCVQWEAKHDIIIQSWPMPSPHEELRRYFDQEQDKTITYRPKGWMDMRALSIQIIDDRRFELMEEHGMTSDAALAQAFIEQAERLLGEEE